MLEYFTSQHEQVILRMNKTGEVSFNVTSYIPLYFSVKWSNATGGIQTIKLKRGESATFSFNSTTATDQEVIVYHSKHIKRLDNLSNLNLSSCLLGNASKLAEVEIHSPLLYNINVIENKFLKRLDLSGCNNFASCFTSVTKLDMPLLTFVGLRASISLTGNKSLKSIMMENMPTVDSITVNFSSNGIDATALSNLMTLLGNATNSTLNITGNAGYSTCDKTIATKKGWKVT